MIDDKLRSARLWLLARSARVARASERVHDDLGRETRPRCRVMRPTPPSSSRTTKFLQAIEEAARSELEQIDRALERLDAGMYGLCEGCGAMIDAERLRVVPYATHCRECAPDA